MFLPENAKINRSRTLPKHPKSWLEKQDKLSIQYFIAGEWTDIRKLRHEAQDIPGYIAFRPG